jgi:hypothetical protein
MTDDQAWELWADKDETQLEYDLAVIQYDRLRRNQVDIGPVWESNAEATAFAHEQIREARRTGVNNGQWFGVRGWRDTWQVYRQELARAWMPPQDKYWDI